MSDDKILKAIQQLKQAWRNQDSDRNIKDRELLADQGRMGGLSDLEIPEYIESEIDDKRKLQPDSVMGVGAVKKVGDVYKLGSKMAEISPISGRFGAGNRLKFDDSIIEPFQSSEKAYDYLQNQANLGEEIEPFLSKVSFDKIQQMVKPKLFSDALKGKSASQLNYLKKQYTDAMKSTNPLDASSREQSAQQLQDILNEIQKRK